MFAASKDLTGTSVIQVIRDLVFTHQGSSPCIQPKVFFVLTSERIIAHLLVSIIKSTMLPLGKQELMHIFLTASHIS